MSDLVPWLRAQLDEDERLIGLQPPWPWHLNAEGDEVWAEDDELVADAHALSSNQQRNTAAHIARWDPARALAEVEAKRQVIGTLAAAHARQEANAAEFVRLTNHPSDGNRQIEYTMTKTHGWELGGQAAALLYVVRLIALPYADRPGYRDEWRPDA